MMNGPENVGDLITKLDIIADEFRNTRQVERERVVRTAIILIEQFTTDAWHDAMNDPPKRGGTYLCACIYPDSRGGFIEKQAVVMFDSDNKWHCNGMIVTHWREKPEGPTRGLFHVGM